MADGRCKPEEVRGKIMMKQLGTSIHKDMTTYLQDFGFGGFLGYGSGVPCGLMDMEELMRGKM